MQPCDKEIFNNGSSIVTLDACRHRAEDWVKKVAKLSGQRVDWHYSGGIANVLYIGDYTKVQEAISQLAASLRDPMPRKPNECGSCCGNEHRIGYILSCFDADVHGPYRYGDLIADDVLAAESH